MRNRPWHVATFLHVFALLFLCVSATPALAKDARYADGVLSIDTLNYNNVTYQVQLAPVAGSNPIAFTLINAQAVASTSNPAATLVGTTLTLPNVLVNGTERLSVRMQLTGQDPVRFVVFSFSTVRSVTLDTGGQTLTPGKAFNVKYSGGALPASKIQLAIGASSITPKVAGDAIVATVPAGMQGGQTLSVTLDGDTFQLPLTITPVAPVANPRSYVNNFIADVAVDLQRLGLPADLLDSATLSTQLAGMSEADAQQAALLLRENLSQLSTLTNALNGSALALNALTPTANLTECERLMVNYLRAASVMSLSAGVVVVGGVAATALPLSGPFALAAAVATATAIVSGELAAQYQTTLLTLTCREVSDATIGILQEVRSDVTVKQTLNVFESRAQTVLITELQQLDNEEVRGDFRAASTAVKATVDQLSALLTSLGFSASNKLMIAVKALQTKLKTTDTQQLSTNTPKYVIRAISDNRVSGSVLPSTNGGLTLLLDRKDTDMPDGQSISFTMELYNATDDVSIRVLVKLSGASPLEDLKLAAVGLWTVTRTDSGVVYEMQLNAGGKGVYRLPGTSCPNGVVRPTGCEYDITWTITKSGNNYLLNEYGFWHPAYNDVAIVGRTPVTLPLTGFVIHDVGNVNAVGIRYVKR